MIQLIVFLVALFRKLAFVVPVILAFGLSALLSWLAYKVESPYFRSLLTEFGVALFVILLFFLWEVNKVRNRHLKWAALAGVSALVAAYFIKSDTTQGFVIEIGAGIIVFVAIETIFINHLRHAAKVAEVPAVVPWGFGVEESTFGDEYDWEKERNRLEELEREKKKDREDNY